MTEHRSVVAILVYSSGPFPDSTGFAQMMKGERYSLDRYWLDNAAGVLQLDRFDLIGPLAITLPDVAPGVATGRRVTLDAAQQAARDAGYDLSPYDTTLAVLSPGTDSRGTGYDAGNDAGTRSLLLVSDLGSVFEHEFAHALGFREHSQGRLVYPTSAGLAPDYGDPYDLMSAGTYGNNAPFQQVVPPAGYPNGGLVGPMLSRAVLHLNKAADLEATGVVLLRAEEGSTSVELFAAGTGGPGRPELLVYTTSGGRRIYVEHRRPGAEGDRNWWDGGLQDLVQGGTSASSPPAALVVHYVAPDANQKDAAFYAGRIAFPDADLDTSFVTPDGTFTVSVSDAQHPAADRVGFTIARGRPVQPVLMVHEDTSDDTRVITSELRINPRYPSDGPFTWQTRRTVRTLTCTPRVRGVGTWLATDPTSHSDVDVSWLLEADGSTVGPVVGSGTDLRVDHSVLPGTGVITVSNNDPLDGHVAVRLVAQVHDLSIGADPTAVLAQSTVDFAVDGQTEGWGPDFVAFLVGRMQRFIEQVDRKQEIDVHVPIPRPGPVELEQIARVRADLLTVAPDEAVRFEGHGAFRAALRDVDVDLRTVHLDLPAQPRVPR